MDLLNSVGWTVISFIFVLGIMIFVHELGHHMMAKFLKIRVDVFSLGFGPRLFGFRYRDTDYRVSAFPLGGYVKMAGENYDETLSGSEDEFLSRPKLHRFAVAIAGPAMNLGLAVVLLAASFMIGVQMPAFLDQPAVVGYVMEDSPASGADLRKEDIILAVGQSPTPTWEDLQLAVATSPGQEVLIRFSRAGETREEVVVLGEEKSSGTGFLGVLPPTVTMVNRVDSGPAADAGLLAGDSIQKVTDQGRVEHEYEDILRAISGSEGRPLEFEIRRGEQVFTQTITPALIEGQYRIGVLIGPAPIPDTKVERYGLLEAFGKSFERNYQMTALTFDIVGKLLTGQTSLKMMSGPIEIARFSGQAASQGALVLIGFIALVSLQLGIFNLFPIPILDGGVITLLLIEAAMGRDLSMRVKERIFQVGFIFLILLMSIVIFNDISKNI